MSWGKKNTFPFLILRAQAGLLEEPPFGFHRAEVMFGSMFPSLLLHQPLLTSHPSYSLDAEEEIIVTLDPFRSEGGKFLLRLVEAPLPALFMNFKENVVSQ